MTSSPGAGGNEPVMTRHPTAGGGPSIVSTLAAPCTPTRSASQRHTRSSRHTGRHVIPAQLQLILSRRRHAPSVTCHAADQPVLSAWCACLVRVPPRSPRTLDHRQDRARPAAFPDVRSALVRNAVAMCR